ncbi:aminoglycoside phosphotransferase family protein [Streptomyces sp. SID13031]|uniref:phosphotransferase family protein n=1 Tax=Streptomyces sp. SID13031 TaxID=2706046 RepID=UPI0013C72671|nr:aminoglycoside phosphotransferase family protein [Streptomyces sp. SID13031]NEA33117.1 aminoglycoside phosphotransferase family protein [Streptomyces sp. SID13031]
MVEKSCLGSAVEEVVERSGGQLSKVFEVRRNAAEPVIVKVYEPEWAWKQAKEVHIYGLLKDHLGVAVPKVIHAEQGEPAFTVLTKIDGVPLSEAEPPDWKAVYVQLGQLLAKIHRIPQPAYGYLTDEVLEPLPTNDAYMRRQFAKKLREFGELDGDPQLAEDISRYVDQHAELLSHNTAPVLCHNDFHEGNVLVDPETWQVHGFIDVENAIAADPLMDLAKTECYSIWGNADKLAGLTEGYGDLPTDWRARTTLYRLYHSLELWDWFKSIGTVDPLDSIAGDIAKIVRR